MRKYLYQCVSHYSELPVYREGGVECDLTPPELGRVAGCVNWNVFYTNCTTGPHNPHHGAVSFDNIGLN